MAQPNNQPYDAALKALLNAQTAEMLPYLLPGATFVRAMETDILKPQPPLRGDKVFEIIYHGMDCILHSELETTGNAHKMPFRMNSYHGLLLERYERPVISLAFYPFKTAIPAPPLIETCGPETLLMLNYKIVAMWEMDARHYLQEQAVSMYPLVPTMDGATSPVLEEAIDGLKQNYQGKELSHRLLWFQTLMNRVQTIPFDVKEHIGEMIHMFDELLEDDPYIIEQRKRAAEHAIVQTLQGAVIDAVQARFPSLVEEAQPKVARMTQPDALRNFMKQVMAAPDENFVRTLLSMAT